MERGQEGGPGPPGATPGREDWAGMRRWVSHLQLGVPRRGRGGGSRGAGRWKDPPRQQLTWELLQPPNPLGSWSRCLLAPPQPMLRRSGSLSPCAGGDSDFLPSRCRREERGPRVPTALPEEGKPRESSD